LALIGYGGDLMCDWNECKNDAGIFLEYPEHHGTLMFCSLEHLLAWVESEILKINPI
jgi:hypothetical protein